MKRVVSLLVSLLLMAVIYWKIDTRGLIAVFRHCNVWWMGISLSMVIPLTLLTAWRLQQLMPTQHNRVRDQPRLYGSVDGAERDFSATELSLPFAEANRLILAACTLNMVLPSKMGDIAKAYFMRDRGHLDGALSLSLVVFEKACDMLSLLLWCALGLILYPQKGWLFEILTLSVVSGLGMGLLLISSQRVARLSFRGLRSIAPKPFKRELTRLETAWVAMHSYFWGDRVQLWRVAGLSVFIWFLHLLQIWFFILALNAWTPFLENLALAPLAILAGLLPLTFAGVGTRDAALIAFYHPFLNAPTAAALGLLCTSRYLLPAIAGLPFLGQYLVLLRKLRSTGRS